MIGVFDSGHGGLTVLRALVDHLPDRHFVYFGDHRHAPYGNRQAEDIYALTVTAVDRLFQLGCPLVIMACNTAAATGLRRLQQDWLPQHYPDRRVLGVLVPVVEVISGQPWMRESPGSGHAGEPRTIAIFATRHTVQSDAYRREITARAPEVTVVQQACPQLVRLIELDAPKAKLRRAVRQYVGLLSRRMAGRPLDAVVLGCTHYPLIADLFVEALPEGMEIISQPDVAARSLLHYLERHPEFAPPDEAGVSFYTTGDAARVTRFASRFFGGSAQFEHLD